MPARNKRPWDLPSEGDIARFQQRSGGRRVRIAIDRVGLDYEFRDINGENHFRVMFEQIDPERSRVVEKNGWLLRFGVTWSILGLLGSLLDSASGLATPIMFVGFGAVCVFYYFWRKATFTVLRTERGRISIIDGAIHDDILSELNTRRVATLREKLLQIDHDNHRKAEMNKYVWLRRVGAITDVELSQFASMLQGDHEARQSYQPPTISLN